MSIRSQVTAAINANPDATHNALARKVAAEVGHDGLIELAVERIEHMIVSERRRRIRALEEESTGLAAADGTGWSAVDALLEEFREAVVVDWTRELLGSVFAVGDGSSVTWGSATREQHLARIALLVRNVRGNLEAIRRHEAAVRILDETGASSLVDVVA